MINSMYIIKWLYNILITIVYGADVHMGKPNGGSFFNRSSTKLNISYIDNTIII